MVGEPLGSGTVNYSLELMLRDPENPEFTEIKQGDDDGHPGNWLWNPDLKKLYRIDYDKFTE